VRRGLLWYFWNKLTDSHRWIWDYDIDTNLNAMLEKASAL
jgi:hypothetical protein